MIRFNMIEIFFYLNEIEDFSITFQYITYHTYRNTYQYVNSDFIFEIQL